MTHSHDTSTPAMSAESEYVLVPRDRGQTFSNSTLPTEMIAAGMEVLERADDDLAGRNGEDVPDWDYGMEAVAVYRAMIAAAPAPNPSPSAKSGEAVLVRREATDAEEAFFWEAYEQYQKWKIEEIFPRPTLFHHLRDAMLSVALSTPTEGPAAEERLDYLSDAQARELFGTEDDDELPDGRVRVCAGEWVRIPGGYYFDGSTGLLHPETASEACDGCAVTITPTEGPASQTEGMGGDAAPDVRLDSEKAEEWPAAQKALWRVVTGENLNDGHYINAYRLTEKLYAACAALTPPETAEAVPVGDAAQEAEAYIQAAVDRAPEPLRRLGEWLANKLDEDDWKTAERMLLGAATASDPAPATDDRERLVEALREARQWVEANTAQVRGLSLEAAAPGETMLRKIDDALATEASR